MKRKSLLLKLSIVLLCLSLTISLHRALATGCNVKTLKVNALITAPAITAISPSSGPVGTLVTITGTDLHNPTAFTIGGVTAIVITNTGTQITGMVMPGATTGPVTITTADGTASSAVNFTITASPHPGVQQAKLVGTGSVGESSQGLAVAVSADGNTAVVGGGYDNGSGVRSGAAWVYARSGSTWTQQGSKLVGTGNVGNANQGYSVAISADGNTLIMGGLFDNNFQGAAWVFTRTAGVWTQQGGKLTGAGNAGAADFGAAVALSADGNMAIIGGPEDNNEIGATWVFTRTGGVWTQFGDKLVGTGNDGQSRQGWSVAISADGNTAAVGGSGDHDGDPAPQGAVWIFTLSGGTWTQQGAKLIGAGAANPAEQGWSVAISADGNTIVEGGIIDNSHTNGNTGAAWIFARSGGVWTQQGPKLVGTVTGNIDQQGESVAITADGNTVLVGGSGTYFAIGAVWQFTRSGGTWSQLGGRLIGTGNISTPTAEGWSVSISADGSTALVGGEADNINTGAAWVYSAGPDVPAISYTSPHVYNVGTAITPLAPSSSAIAVAGYDSGNLRLVSSGSGGNTAIATDAAGNLYSESNYLGVGHINKASAEGSAGSAVGSGYNNPKGIAVDAAGNVYVADYGHNAVKKVPVAGGTTLTIGSGFFEPMGVAVDASGNVYVADAGNNAVKKIPVGGGSPVTIGSGFSFPTGVAVDSLGNVYVADYGNNAIKEIPAGGGAVVTIGSGFSNPRGISIDGSGNIFVADAGNNAIKEIVAGGSIVSIGSGFNGPTGVATSADGSVFVADSGSYYIEKIKPVGGYYISPALPAGLGFDNTTGTISGTPAVASHATNYMVTAYNAGGSASATFSIKVVNNNPTANANLAGLTISSGTLTPVFDPIVNSYTDTVGSAVTSVTVTPTVDNINATVKVNGVSVTSGSPSAAIPLTDQPNIITVSVTAQDGVTKNNYTITVTHLSSNAYLSSLVLSSGNLAPAFNKLTGSYTASVSNATASINVKPTANFPKSTIKVNGVAVNSGTTSPDFPLNIGANTISTVVTAQNGTTHKTYTVTVTRVSNDATLSALVLSSGTLTPVFDPATGSYTASVTNGTASVTVTPVLNYSGASVQVNGTAVTSGTPSAAIPLAVGNNVIEAVVTAQDGVTKKKYSILINRVSNNAYLSDLHISNGVLSPVFSMLTTSYTDTVGSNISSVIINPTLNNPHGSIKVNGVTVASGTASGSITLTTGNNTITTVVTAQDGVTKKTYTIVVTRVSNNAYLSNLVLSSGTLSPAFTLTTSSYTASVANDITSVTVTPTLNNPHGSVKVNGTTTASGTASAAIPLAVGDNTISTVVTAQDGVTHKTYTVTITRAVPGLNNLYLPGSGEQTPLIASLGEKVQANNILSPNGDGINDIWVVKNIAFYPDNTVTVYDRAGKVVFTKKGYTNDWDGTYRGSVLSEGTYYYLVDLGNGSTMKGFITVVMNR